MYNAMIFSFLNVLLFMGGIIFFICVIIFMFRFLSLKKEHNQLFREYIQIVKEKKHNEV